MEKCAVRSAVTRRVYYRRIPCPVEPRDLVAHQIPAKPLAHCEYIVELGVRNAPANDVRVGQAGSETTEEMDSVVVRNQQGATTSHHHGLLHFVFYFRQADVPRRQRSVFS